jgi:ketosteroid isomerase-like protein
MKNFAIKLVVVFSFLLLAGCSVLRPSTKVETEIEQGMQRQAEAWNKGDLEAYMQLYWHSDSLLFLGKNGPTYGWEKTLQNYRRSYPNPQAMGKLTFTLLKTNRLSMDVYFVVGKWHLARVIGDVQGHFSLVFRKIAGNWVIVADHSS